MPRRHGKHDVTARLPGLVGALPVLAALGDPPVPVRVVQQRREVVVAADDDVAASTPVAAVRTTHGDVRLATERRRTAPSGSRFDPNDYSI